MPAAPHRYERARLNPAGVRCFIPGALSTACGDQDIFEYGQLVVSASFSSRDAVTSVDGAPRDVRRWRRKLE